MSKHEPHVVEQWAKGFYSQPRDAHEKNALRLMYDRWLVVKQKHHVPILNLLKLDERKAPRDWQISGFNTDQSFLTWSVSFPELFQLVEKKAFQVSN